jgi:hypothetical protein
MERLVLFLRLLLDVARPGAAARSFAAGEADEGAGVAHLDADRERRSMVVHRVQ